MSVVEELDSELRSTDIEPSLTDINAISNSSHSNHAVNSSHSSHNHREGMTQMTATGASGLSTTSTATTMITTSHPDQGSSEFTSTYRPNATIIVHRKSYLPEWSDSGNESDEDSDEENEQQQQDGWSSAQHPKVIGDFVNVGHQNWLALRQEWKKRPVGWTPKRRLSLDSQTICDRITTSGVLSDRPDEGAPLPEVVRVMVQVWEREGVN